MHHPCGATVRETDRFICVYSMAYGGVWLSDPEAYNTVFDRDQHPDPSLVGRAVMEALNATRIANDEEVKAAIAGQGFGGHLLFEQQIAQQFGYISVDKMKKKVRELWVYQRSDELSVRPTKNAGSRWIGRDSLPNIPFNTEIEIIGNLIFEGLAKCE